MQFNSYDQAENYLIDVTMSCDYEEALVQLKLFKAESKKGSYLHTAASVLIEHLINHSKIQKLNYKIQRTRMLEDGNYSSLNKDYFHWQDLWDSEEDLIKDLMRIVAKPEYIIPASLAPRGYEYINSFKRYYCKNHNLTIKQKTVLLKHMYPEIAYSLYVHGTDRSVYDEVFGICKSLQYTRTSYFTLSGMEDLLLWDKQGTGDCYSWEYLDKSEKKNDYSQYGYFLEDCVKKLENYANMVVGPVDCIRYREGAGVVGDFIKVGLDGCKLNKSGNINTALLVLR